MTTFGDILTTQDVGNVDGVETLAVASVSTTPYAPTAANNVLIVDTTVGDITINLPALSGQLGRVFHIKKISSDGNKVILDGNSTETIDGSTTFDVKNQYTAYTIVGGSGTDWHIV